MDFKDRFRYLLNKYKITQSDLCRSTKIPSSLMSTYYTGRAVPSLESAILLADGFKISLDELVGREKREEVYSLSLEEFQLLGKYNKLNKASRQSAVGYLDFLSFREYESGVKG